MQIVHNGCTVQEAEGISVIGRCLVLVTNGHHDGKEEVGGWHWPTYLLVFDKNGIEKHWVLLVACICMFHTCCSTHCCCHCCWHCCCHCYCHLLLHGWWHLCHSPPNHGVESIFSLSYTCYLHCFISTSVDELLYAIFIIASSSFQLLDPFSLDLIAQRHSEPTNTGIHRLKRLLSVVC